MTIKCIQYFFANYIILYLYISENSSFTTSPDDPSKINNIEKNTNLEDLDGIPIVYQVKHSLLLNF